MFNFKPTKEQIEKRINYEKRAINFIINNLTTKDNIDQKIRQERFDKENTCQYNNNKIVLYE